MFDRRRIKTAIFAVIFALFAAALIAGALIPAEKECGASYLGRYTFEREAVVNGKTVEFFESGDERFHYIHDKDGFILLREESGIFYARNECGAPVSSGVSIDAPRYKIDALDKMTAAEIDFESNPDLISDYETITSEPLLSAPGGGAPIYNLVIYIMFADENATAVRNSLPSPNYFTGPGSMRDYFLTMSDNSVSIFSAFAKNSDSTDYIYKDTNNRSYYVLNGQGNTPTRYTSEGMLLEAALNSAKSKFDLSGVDLDVNDDGYIDSLSFVVSQSKTDWGDLLWPHSFNFLSMNRDVRINGIRANKYSFNFMNGISVGVISHEMFHVLGAPDLYDYDYTYAPVGYWDIMQFNQDVPQYSLAYMRNRYLGGLYSTRIGTISHNGIYSLKPVSVAGVSDTIAYKIPTSNPNEYFMVERRDPDVSSGFDRLLPGSGGLIVYRVRESVTTGNQNSVFGSQSAYFEVYVFRPEKLSESGSLPKNTRYNNSKSNVDYAAVSAENPYFTSLGAPASAGYSTYDRRTVFYSDGINSGIVITPIGTGNEFRVSLNGADNIDNTYFNDKITASGAGMVNSDFSGVSLSIGVGEIDISYLMNIRAVLTASDGSVMAANELNVSKFRDAYAAGMRSFDCKFVVSDKGGVIGGVFTAGAFNYEKIPSQVKVYVIDADGDGSATPFRTLEVAANGLSWAGIKLTRLEPSPSVEASAKLTIGIKSSGTAIASGSQTVNQWDVYGRANVMQAAAGLSHTVLLFKDMTAVAVGEDRYGETAVSGWANVRYIAAGEYTTYGVTIDGKVLAAGNNAFGQLDVSGWAGITAVAAGKRHVLGLDSSGRVFGTGDNSSGQLDNLSSLSGIVAIAAGGSFSAFLKSDGTVEVTGSIADKDSVRAWLDVVKIAAGGSFLYGLTSEKKVLAAGDNSYGQLNVQNLLDIIDIAGGETHGAFLRSDGVVEFAGSGAQYNATSMTGNLIYANYVEATGVRINSAVPELLTGSSFILSASVLPANATYTRLDYSSLNPSVASVNEYGKITAIGQGTATIVVKRHGTTLSASVVVSVRQYIPLVGLSFLDPVKNIMVGQSAVLVLVLNPSDATLDGQITYTSSNQNVAAVDQSGAVRALALGSAVITARYVGNIVAEAACAVNAVNEILSVQLDPASSLKKNYLFGEPFDPAGGRINVTIRDFDGVIHVESQKINSAMVSGYDPEILGVQSVKVIYMGRESAPFEVTVGDYVLRIDFNSYPKTEYLYGDAFDPTGGSIALHKRSGAVEIRAMRIADAENFNSLIIGGSLVTIKIGSGAESFTLALPINVKDTVREVRALLTKYVYNYLENWNARETLTLVMNSGAEKAAEIVMNGTPGSDLSVAYGSNFRSDILGNRTLAFSYTDALTSENFSATARININLVGNFSVLGGDPDGIFWYEAGKTSPAISVALAQEGRIINISDDPSQNAYFAFQGDFGQTGDSTAFVEVYFRSTDVQNVGYKQIYTRSISVRGIKPIKSTRIIDAKGGAYLYGETPSIKLEIEFTDGEKKLFTPAIVEFDDRKTGGVPYRFQYAGTWYETNLTVSDYAVRLIPMENKTLNYGENLSLQVFAETAAGATIQIPSNSYSLSSYSTSQIGVQTVTLAPSGAYANLAPISFALQILDVVSSITVKTPIKTLYLYGEEFNPYSVYNFKMLSGAVNEVPYGQDFTYSPAFNKNLTGTQQITITYVPTGAKFGPYPAVVSNYCVSLELLTGSKLTYNYGQDLSIYVKANYADGSSVNITSFTTDYKKNVLSAQNVTVTHKETVNGKERTVTLSCQITVSDVVNKVSFAPQTMKAVYKYGEPITFYGAQLTVTYASQSNNPVVYTKNGEISSFACTYNPLVSGQQSVTLSVFGTKSNAFTVTVGPPSEDEILTAEGAALARDASKGILIANEPLTYAGLYAILKSGYLSIRVRTAGGGIAPGDSSDNVISGTAVEVFNSSGVVVRTYLYYLNGDASRDGKFDSSDIPGLAEQYLSGDNLAADYDGDGVYSLTDLVNWARKAARERAGGANAAAKNFITDIKTKEEAGEDNA
jgi:Bacterial surface proteins containing Ig-like domains